MRCVLSFGLDVTPFDGPAEPKNKNGSDQSAEGRSKSRRVLIDAERVIARDHQPIKQRRLLKPRVTAEGWRDPIVTRKHLARDFGIARLVWANQGQDAQTEQIKKCNCEKRQFPGAFGKCYSRQVYSLRSVVSRRLSAVVGALLIQNLRQARKYR